MQEKIDQWSERYKKKLSEFHSALKNLKEICHEMENEFNSFDLGLDLSDVPQIFKDTPQGRMITRAWIAPIFDIARLTGQGPRYKEILDEFKENDLFHDEDENYFPLDMIICPDPE